MFQGLGGFISRWSVAILAAWAILFAVLQVLAPDFDSSSKGGEFVFLPANMPSRQGEDLLNRAFPGRNMTSNMVIVASREESDGITDDDRTFIDDKLRPALLDIRDRFNGPKTDDSSEAEKPKADHRLITDIHTFSEAGIGKLLNSEDGKATLVVVDMTTDFQDSRNWGPVQAVSEELQKLKNQGDIPKGLDFELTGSATLGRDITSAEEESARDIAWLTIVMVVVLLVVIYRAPLIAIVPLLTLYVAVDVALNTLSLLARSGYVSLFQGLRAYITVITYGPGIDYCLFLIARYKENLEEFEQPENALSHAVSRVSAAIAASAATVVCGIGMLSFAQFGKFHEAGIAISIALVITMLATLTLTPALLHQVGHWAFWPKPGLRKEAVAGDSSTQKAASQKNLFQPMWDYMSHVIEHHPISLMLGTLTAMVPLIVFAVIIYGRVNYGLLESLPTTATSVRGADVLQRHFSAGIIGPIGVLLHNAEADYGDSDGIDLIHEVSQKLYDRREQLTISDIRSVSDPLGVSPKGHEAAEDTADLVSLIRHKETRRRGVEYYVATAPGFEGKATELDIIPSVNPFSVQSVDSLQRITGAVKEALPPDQAAKTRIVCFGPTASVNDINIISRADQQRIYVLVITSVLVILVVLLRSVTISVYLIVTVLLSYMTTLGATWLIFYLRDPTHFNGLDWTVPLFLFVMLIAIGEDYNIFLVTRVREEQDRNGPTRGITTALSRTGGIITSCGFIMAGTFASLCAGSLARMQELGVALALGVMLDTFVIRPILVPAFLMIIHDHRYGNMAQHLK